MYTSLCNLQLTYIHMIIHYTFIYINIFYIYIYIKDISLQINGKVNPRNDSYKQLF